MMGDEIEIPWAWEQLTLERLSGTVMVIGAPDVGKTTFAQYLYRRLCAYGKKVAYLDGDPGQSSLGPPTTMTLRVGRRGEDAFPPPGKVRRSFVGAVSPRGHMLPLVVGASRLVEAAYQDGAEVVIYDTTGLVDPQLGGHALKLAKIDLLQPTTVFGIQRSRELESLLLSLRLSRRVRVVDLAPAHAVRRRDVPARQEHRARQFHAHFEGSRPIAVEWQSRAVFPGRRFRPHQLVALEDLSAFVIALGIVLSDDQQSECVTLQTSIPALDGVDALRLGDVAVDPTTFRDTGLPSV
jgi:polynucleotide 5'-hydroxyl-kinase GRC3/NOL9